MKRLILLPFILLSCGTETGNPVISLQFLLDESQAQAKTTITLAQISAKQIELRNAIDCNGKAEIELQGPFLLDLLAPEPPQSLQNITLKGGAYCRFEFEWNASQESTTGASPELTGKAIVVGGTLPDQTPFIIRSERNGKVRLENGAGSFPIDQATNALFVAFRADALLANLDFTTVTPDANGVLRIESGLNENLLEQFEDNLEQALRLFDDDNGDNELEADEAEDEDILATPSAF
jgi:hypothetical protein